MQLLKKPLLGGAATLLFGVLALFGFTFGLWQVFGSPGPIKRALAGSGFYETAVMDSLEQVQKDQGAAAIGLLPLDRPEVQNVVKSASSPELMQAQTENALDAIYAWARGETPELSFSFEIGEIKDNLASGIEQYAVQYASSLPACEPGAAADTDSLLNAACLPQGIDPGQFAAQAKNNLLQSEALKETTLTPNTIEIGGKTLAEQLQGARNLHRNITWGVYGFGLLALLLAVVTVALGTTWRSGLKKVAIIFIAVGALGVIVSQLSKIGMDRVNDLAKEPLLQSVVKALEILLNDVRNWWFWLGIVLIAAGAAGLAALYFTKPTADTDKGGEDAAPEQPTSETPAPPSQFTTTFAEPKPADTPKSKPPKRLIQ
ncbi:hypothetical protein IRY61_01110 [Candidatus Saccharibacteria bacterium]|nr:hypothetical protein [Candidatus Saccharibacteria bacterium]